MIIVYYYGPMLSLVQSSEPRAVHERAWEQIYQRSSPGSPFSFLSWSSLPRREPSVLPASPVWNPRFLKSSLAIRFLDIRLISDTQLKGTGMVFTRPTRSPVHATSQVRLRQLATLWLVDPSNLLHARQIVGHYMLALPYGARHVSNKRHGFRSDRRKPTFMVKRETPSLGSNIQESAEVLYV